MRSRPTKNLHFSVLIMLVVYLILQFMGGSFGRMVLYPVTLMVTFLHEFGHACGALFTGGTVEGMQINPDGSGYTVTRGGSQAVVLMGGYLGSAVLGNLLFNIGFHYRRVTDTTLMILAGLMALSGIIWFESVISTFLLFAFAAALWFIATRTPWDQDVLMFLGLACVLYIIEDFSVGPRSDLAMYEQVVGVFSSQVWMYVWLLIVLLISYANVRHVFGRKS